MSIRLHDATRIRSLRSACRRTGEVDRPPWWILRRRTAQENAANDRANAVVFRFMLCVLITVGGLLLTKGALAAQVLTLVALVLVQTRITRYQQQLENDPGLLLLASLPLTDRDILSHQLRPSWHLYACNVIEGAGFWAVAWSLAKTIPWWWLPVVGVTHALVIEAAALALLLRWRRPGCLLFPIVVAMIWAISAQDKYPVVHVVLDPALTLLAWATPMGWLNALAFHLPSSPWLAASAVMLALAAAVVIRTRRQHLATTWRLHPLFRESLGRPGHTWLDADSDDERMAPDGTIPEPSGQTSATVQESNGTTTPVDDGSSAYAASAALTTARARVDGATLAAFGWPGWLTLRRLDAVDRRLVDQLKPSGMGPAQWRWALLCAATPAMCVLTGLPAYWSLIVLTVTLLGHGLVKRGLLIAGLLVVTLIAPQTAPLLAIGLPCLAAILLGTPLMGLLVGGWHGLPMNWSVLGTVPRTWWRLMRIMLLLTGLRMIAGIPILGLVLTALGLGVDLIPCGLVAAGWVMAILSTPWIIALRLVQRTPNGIDISLGRAGATAANVLCIIAHLGWALAVLIGALQPTITGEPSRAGFLLIAGGILWALVNTTLHVALLRHAYRRVVDLV